MDILGTYAARILIYYNNMIGRRVYKAGFRKMSFLHGKGRFLSAMLILWCKGAVVLSRRDKKAAGLEQHKKLMREKEMKRKQKREVSLPTKHNKGKK